MPKREKYVPKHRQAKHRGEPARPVVARKVVGSTVAFSSAAVVATGVVVSGGVLNADQVPLDAASAGTTVSTGLGDSGATSTAIGTERLTRILTERSEAISRSDRRENTDPAKEAALAQDGGAGMVEEVELSDSDPRDIAQALLPEYGFSSDQFSCLDSLWTKESGWSVTADNPTSSAYGIPQSLPGEKMASEGADWATNPETQIRWGLGYIQDRYGSPCGAWSHSVANNWY
ncbi:lytic transglycosylase domain-containing protein [Nocardioides sp. CFH 31398]|uniref:aggregation-promoting factor C-terminal-like domain-containing protein n=1 Tax=Nocardioides sp. CFH 31398 TaxID=2919579 RepID=UPI001F059608|nr:lytic transglycosylase domain-containing protein [Nocardioides sp. CFH 31398]MCH1868137.1 lytic transglycosylase domain-containing protein [Nocardioides sp. CFH 31398]